MAPIRPKYVATPLRLAASLGSPVARDLLPAEERATLDDAFAVLMSCSDIVLDDDRFDFGPPRYWPYPLEAAIRMALSAYRAFLPDWDAAFLERRAQIPGNVPEDHVRRVLETVGGWVLDPPSFRWDDHEGLYGYIKDNVCLDGYLNINYPSIPRVVGTMCIGSLYLIDIENCQPDAGPIARAFDPTGIYSARMNDAIGQLLDDGLDEARIRRAICDEVIPWCLGESEPLAGSIGTRPRIRKGSGAWNSLPPAGPAQAE